MFIKGASCPTSMHPAVFNKQMDSYLERRGGSFCKRTHTNIFARIYCSYIVPFGKKVKVLALRLKSFFTRTEPEDIAFSESEVVVVDAGMSPAQRILHDAKDWIKHAFSSKQDSSQRAPAEDVDPEKVAEVIRKNRL